MAEHGPPEATPTVADLLQGGAVRDLSPLQKALKPILWFLMISILACLVGIIGIWVHKMPEVPSGTLKPEDISQYRELTEIAQDSAEKMMDMIMTKILLPLFLGFGSVFVGKSLKNSSED